MKFELCNLSGIKVSIKDCQLEKKEGFDIEKVSSLLSERFKKIKNVELEIGGELWKETSQLRPRIPL